VAEGAKIFPTGFENLVNGAILATILIGDNDDGEGNGLLTVDDIRKLLLETQAIAFGDETTDITVGTGKAEFIIPFNCTISAVYVGLTTAPTGSVATFDVNVGGTSILSTKVTIDPGEKNSNTADIPPVISTPAYTAFSAITVDIDGIGSSDAGAGPKLYLEVTRT
jgi:hypothetical protein